MSELARLGRSFPAGTILFHEGEPGEEMYVIQSGRVQLTRIVCGKEVHLLTLPPGEFFGEMAIVNQRPRSATAQVIEDAQLLVLDAKTFEAMVRSNAEIAVRFIKKLATRLEQANAQVEVLLLQGLNHRVAHELRSMAALHGVPDGAGVRVDGALEALSTACGAAVLDVTSCVERLEKARLVHRVGDSIHIAEVGKLDQFLEFLQMKEQFGG